MVLLLGFLPLSAVRISIWDGAAIRNWGGCQQPFDSFK